jgi:hypothetical protein
MTNMPKLMDLIIKVVKRLLPKKTTEKVQRVRGGRMAAWHFCDTNT